MKFLNGAVEYSANGTRGGLTFGVAAGAEEGDAVTLTSAATVGRGAAGAPFVGKLVKIEKDGLGNVMHQDMVTVPANPALTVGYKLLVVDGAGMVNEGVGGRPGLVIGIQDGMAVIDLG
jgi:hypothetical protein